jgi:hypothetical protein
MNLAAFIGLLGAAASGMHEAETKALEKAAKVVEAEAKREIGEYQAGAGPFAAWAELADYTKEDRLKRGYTENDPGLRTGEMRDGIGHAVHGSEAVVGSNDDKLVWFELGRAGVNGGEPQPPRSVLGIAAVHKSKEVAHICGETVVMRIAGKTI